MLATLARQTGQLSLSTMFEPVSGAHWLHSGPVLALVVIALMIVLLAENARMPVDDPNTHLELTMIHEVMVLDHSGPDFAFILYSCRVEAVDARRRWSLGMVLPSSGGNPWLDLPWRWAACSVWPL